MKKNCTERWQKVEQRRKPSAAAVTQQTAARKEHVVSAETAHSLRSATERLLAVTSRLDALSFLSTLSSSSHRSCSLCRSRVAESPGDVATTQHSTRAAVLSVLGNFRTESWFRHVFDPTDITRLRFEHWNGPIYAVWGWVQLNFRLRDHVGVAQQP